MGRRALTTLNPQEARAAVAKHFRRLTNSQTGVNLAQFQAQLKEQEAVRLIQGFMEDPTLPVAFRKECALDVIKIARGPITPWFHDGKSVDPNAEGQTGQTVGTEIEAAKLTAELHERLNDLVMRKVPVDRWPEDVRAAAGEFMATFSEVDET